MNLLIRVYYWIFLMLVVGNDIKDKDEYVEEKISEIKWNKIV